MNPFSIQRVHSKDRKKGIGSNHDPWMMIIIVIKRMKKNSTVTLGRNFKTLRDFEGLKWHASHVHALSFQAKNVFVSPLVFYLLRILCLKLYRVSYVTTVGTIVELTTCVFKICSSHMIKKKICAYSDFPLGLIWIFYNLFWTQVSLVLLCVDSFALSKGMTSLLLKRMMSLLGLLDSGFTSTCCSFLILALFYRVSFHLSPVQDFRIPVQHCFFLLVAALHVSLPSAQSSDWCYLLKYSESGITNLLYETHNDSTEIGKNVSIWCLFSGISGLFCLIFPSALSSFLPFLNNFLCHQ